MKTNKNTTYYMTHPIRNLTRVFAVAVTTLLTASCSTFIDETNPYAAQEAMKDLSGSWQLRTVTRNGIDITRQMDFSRFRLNLNPDGTYSIQNYLPFVVNAGGTWTVNDPLHPMLLTFKEQGADAGISLDFSYPVVDGSRAIRVTLSPGCPTNSYVYTLYRDKTE